MPQEAAKAVEPDIFAGSEPDPVATEEISGDRGDALEPVAANETPETSVADQKPPVGEPQQPETPAAEPEKAGEEPDHSEQRIPKSRFDQVNERRKLAEQRARELEAQLEAQKQAAQPPVAYDFDAAEQKYMEAVVDGEFEKAKAIRAEIRTAERFALEAEVKQTREVASTEAVQRIKFDETVASLQREFPAFDAESDAYDELVTSEALELYHGYMATGRYSAIDALTKAARVVAKAAGLESANAPKAEPKAPARDTKPDFAKKTDAANKQPPVKSLGSKGDTTPNVLEMSEDEFSALPESTLRKLRGDVL